MTKKMSGSLRGNDFVSTVTGGSLREINRDGDYVTDIPVPPGRHRVFRFMVGIGRDHRLVPGDNVMCFPADMRHAPSNFGEMQYETAASQRYKVDDAERALRREKRMESMMARSERVLRLQERALSRSRGPDPDEVSEAEAKAKAEAEAKAKAKAEAEAKAKAEAEAKAKPEPEA